MRYSWGLTRWKVNFLLFLTLWFQMHQSASLMKVSQDTVTDQGWLFMDHCFLLRDWFHDGQQTFFISHSLGLSGEGKIMQGNDVITSCGGLNWASRFPRKSWEAWSNLSLNHHLWKGGLKWQWSMQNQCDPISGEKDWPFHRLRYTGKIFDH